MTSKLKIFLVIFLPAGLALLLGLALVQQHGQAVSRAQFEDQLRNQWLLVSVIQRSALDGGAFRATAQSLDLRVTLVASDGSVVLDTGADGETMEDHAQREEIRSAFLGRPAMAVRQSRTTGRHTIYYARLLEPGLVLRVAYPADYFRRMDRALMSQALWAMAALTLMVGLFALAVSRAQGRTFARLSEAVTEAKNGGELLPTFRDDALDSALHALSSASRGLKSMAEENARLGARLSYILEHVQEGVILLKDQEVVYHNERANQILNFPLPRSLTLINLAHLIAMFGRLTADDPAKEITIGERIVAVDHHVDGPTRLIVLHDVTDREKYSGFKTELVANISHELKTPLTLIMATSELIVKDPTMPPEIMARFLTTIFNNSRRLDIILDDLISLHRLETLEGAEPVDSGLEEVVGEVRELVDLKGKSCRWTCDRGPAGVHPSHLQSVLINLVTNAVKYSADPEIEVSALIRGPVLEVAVSDGGPVIPPAERERIFERFYSISSSRSRDRSGSGLGLAIVKHVAKLYDGQAKVSENARGGNTFTVRLTRRIPAA